MDQKLCPKCKEEMRKYYGLKPDWTPGPQEHCHCAESTKKERVFIQKCFAKEQKSRSVGKKMRTET